MIHMGVARKWHFSTSGGAVNLGGISEHLSEHRGSGIPLLGIASLFMHKLTGLFLKFYLQNRGLAKNPKILGIFIIRISDLEILLLIFTDTCSWLFVNLLHKLIAFM